ncbi:MAG: hypothetical protein HPY60_00330 [Candidatus Methanofastidiosum sp.]|nr:hypothetical protein [Methanofastidiosum sp.]
MSLLGFYQRDSYLSFEWDKKDYSTKKKDITSELVKIENIIKKDSNNTSAWFSKGVLLFDMLWIEEGSFIRYSKKEKSIQNEIDWFELTKETIKYFDSIYCFDKALESDPNNLEAVSYKAGAIMLNGNLEEAVGIFRNLVEKNPNNFSMWNDLGVSLFELGLNQMKKNKNILDNYPFFESINCFKKSIELKSDYTCALYNAANLYRSLNNYFSSLIYYNLILEKDKDKFDTIIKLSESFILMNFYSKAKELYKRAFEIDSNLLLVYFEEIPLFVMGGGNDEYELSKIALEIYPENLRFNDWVLMCGYANCFAKEIDFLINIANNLITNNYGYDHYIMSEFIEELIKKEMIHEAMDILDNFNIEKYYLSGKSGYAFNLFYFGNKISSGGFEDWTKEFFNKCIFIMDNLAPILIEKNDLSTLKMLLNDKVEMLISLKKYDEALNVLKSNNNYFPDDIEFIHNYEAIYYNKEEFIKVVYFSDRSLEIDPNNNYSKILKISSLSNLGLKNDALNLIKELAGISKLPDNYYRYLLNISFELKNYNLCEEIFSRGFDTLKNEELKTFVADYNKIQKFIHENDETEKERLKKELEEEITKSKIEIDFNKLEEKMDKQHKEAMEAHGFTHKKLDNLSSLMSLYGKKLTKIKQSTDSIDDKVEKIQEQTIQVKDVLKKKYPNEFEEIKEELRKKLEI